MKVTFGNVLRLATGLYTAKQQYDAGKQAEEIQDRNAQRVREETAEQARRLDLDQRRARAQLVARAEASGLKTTGSTSVYLDEFDKENTHQLDWLNRSGESRASIFEDIGDNQKESLQYGAFGSFFKSVNKFGSDTGLWGS